MSSPKTKSRPLPPQPPPPPVSQDTTTKKRSRRRVRRSATAGVNRSDTILGGANQGEVQGAVRKLFGGS